MDFIAQSYDNDIWAKCHLKIKQSQREDIV